MRLAADGAPIAYFECESCHSLQTEEPYWLPDAYNDDQSPNLDTYVAERTLLNQMMVYFLFKTCGIRYETDKVLDWGGGHGLLVRMLRDVEIDAYHYDKYETNRFATTFDRTGDQHYSFITCFEVWEHFARPMTDIEAIFRLNPDRILISTCIYRNHGKEWPYLGPPKGEHVFFYSEQAMRSIGSKYGYHVTRFFPEFTFFHRTPIPKIRRLALRWLMPRAYLRGIVFALVRKRSLSNRDNLKIRAMLDPGEISLLEPSQSSGETNR
jgi:hypothetical protein